MEIMKNLILPALFVIMGLLSPLAVNAQDGSDRADSEDTEESIILSPVADLQAYQVTGRGSYKTVNGLVFGKGVIGVETVYRQPEARADLGFSLSAYYDSHDTFDSDGSLLIGTLSIGRTLPVTDFIKSNGMKRAEVYFRVAPGFGVAGRGIIGSGRVQYFPGVTATTEFGVIYHLTEQMSLFSNAGGRYYWFPGLDEVGLLGRPVVMLGVQFDLTGGFSMVRF